MTAASEEIRGELIRALSRYGEQLYSRIDDQVHVQLRQADSLLELAAFLSAEGYYLVTVVANDERELEDRRFKIYYMFSHPTVDLFVQAEYPLELGAETYPSLAASFPGVDCFEREMADMLGLRPQGPRQSQVATGSWLHRTYPDGLYPLRREQTLAALRARVTSAAGGDGRSRANGPSARSDRANGPSALCDGAGDGGAAGTAGGGGGGGLVLPVGPVHAGIIEPGQFLFSIASEAIEDLQIRLGYAHKGIERLFQSHLDLLEGWWLAEQVCGDSSVAHSLAYCRAAETLAHVRVPPAAELVRGLLLELERIHNHVADVAALAEDVSLDRLASDVSIVRECLLRLNKRLTGHRYLRRINRPGGVVLATEFDVAGARATLSECLDRFAGLAGRLAGEVGFRDRTIGIGILTREQALRLGVTGLAARASGVPRDSRWQHPTGVYAGVPAGVYAGGPAGGHAGVLPPAGVPAAVLPPAGASPPTAAARGREAHAGDVYARFLARVDEVAAAREIVGGILDRWAELEPAQRAQLRDEPRVFPENNYTFAFGHAEGFRGDVFYWLMQDKLNGIYRCKVRDPSMLNWPALRQAVLPGMLAGKRVETVLADFPLVNKSFNLSYSGNDL